VRVVLLDGGTGLELLNRSANKTPRHWSAEYLLSEPDLVREVHLDYIRAGAKVVTVNAYSATYTRMSLVDAAERVPELQRRACEIARAARDAAGEAAADVAVAGCLPPLNGTYRPDRVRDFATNLEEYRRLAALQAPHVDLFLCETMSTAAEARAAATAACEHGKPVWVGWSLMDDAPWLRSGERIAAAVAALAGLDVGAVLANCAPPESVSAAIPELVATGLPAGGYANGFTGIPATFLPGRTREQLHARTDLGPDIYADFAMRWIADGAAIVGGCCEVGPAHIARLREALLAAGHVIVGPGRLAAARYA
jgi:S-methylmethionine-dependent homocysteine/selenocysteine methylase